MKKIPFIPKSFLFSGCLGLAYLAVMTSTTHATTTSDVLIHGEIIPTLISVTVPTDPLSFVINPNLAEDKTFIAPNFKISNTSNAPLSLELFQFEQTTSLMNDVLPTTHNDWDSLKGAEANDFALGLTPIDSSGWVTLTPGTRYVADSSNYDLGVIASNQEVEFSFNAYHGKNFNQSLSPRYKLNFVIGVAG